MRYTIGMLSDYYKYPVISRQEGSMVTPLVRLVPVKGQEKEALELIERMSITIKER